MSHELTTAEREAGTASAAGMIHAALRFLRALRFRIRYVIAAVIVAALLGAVYYFTATRVYEGTSSLMITQIGHDVWRTPMSGGNGRDSLIPTYEQLFTKDVVLEGVLRRLEKLPPELRVDFTSQPREKWIDVLRTNTSAKSVRRTNMIEIRYRSRSPQAAKAVVRAIVDSYLSFMEKNHKDVSVQIVSLLSEERKEIERRMVERENQLLAAKANVRDLGLRKDSSTVHPIVQRVVELNEELMDVQKERVKLRATLAALKTAVENGADLRHHLIAVEPNAGRELIVAMLGLNPQIADNVHSVERKLIADRAEYDTLRAHYGSRHPNLVKLGRAIEHAEQYLADYQTKLNQRLDDVQQRELGPTLISMLRQRLTQIAAHEQELQEQYTITESEAVALDGRMAEVAILESEVARLRDMHDRLLSRIETIDMHQDQADVRVALVSEPTSSTQPVSPRLSLVAFLCLLGGLGSGAGIVYVLDLLDDRFRSPEELKQQMGVPLLAVIRKLPDGDESGIQSLAVHAAPDAAHSESFRTLRTTLAFSGDDLDRLAITSSEPGDGKTTVLANLAVAFAQSGKKTLLIDADLRRPGLTRMLELRGANGLAHVLRSEEDLATICPATIQATDVERLDVLPSGSRPSDPAELLSSPRMAGLIAWAEAKYDQILIDCPPILAAADAAIVGRLASGTLLVVQPAKNHRRIVLRAADELARMKVNLLGVVVNHVDEENSGDYYGYGIGYGYGEDEQYEDEELADADNSEPAHELNDDGGRVRRRAA